MLPDATIVLRCCQMQPLLSWSRLEDGCRVICTLSVDSFNQRPMRQAHRAHGAQLIFFLLMKANVVDVGGACDVGVDVVKSREEWS
jgi:hypothetical protein